MVEKSCCGNSGQMVIYQTDNKMFYFLFCCQGTEEQTSILPSIIKPLVYGQAVLCVTGLRRLNICYLQVFSLDNATYVSLIALCHYWFHFFCQLVFLIPSSLLLKHISYFVCVLCVTETTLIIIRQ